MQLTTVKQVTIIAEGILRERLLSEITRLGARGYTLSDVHGRGSSGVSDSFWEGAQVKIETLVSPLVADAILRHLNDDYFGTYAVIAFVESVDVIRGEKYC